MGRCNTELDRGREHATAGCPSACVNGVDQCHGAQAASTGLRAPCRREVDEDGEGAPWKEQETWEGEQIKKASMHVGAQDRARAAAQYDFVIDDQIEFIKDQALAGDLVRPLHPATCWAVRCAAYRFLAMHRARSVSKGAVKSQKCISRTCRGIPMACAPLPSNCVKQGPG